MAANVETMFCVREKPWHRSSYRKGTGDFLEGGISKECVR